MITPSAFYLGFPEVLAQAPVAINGERILLVVLALVCVVLGIVLYRSKRAPRPVPSAEELRGRLAQVVTMWAMLVILALAIVMLLMSGWHAAIAKDNAVDAQRQFIDTGKYIFAAIVPVVAAWVGTVMAFYFGKENFKAATDSVSQIARQFTSQDKLGQTPVEKIGMAISDVDPLRLGDGQTKENISLEQVASKMTTPNPPFERLPILTSKGAPYMVVHRSVLTDFLLEKKNDPAAKDKTPAQFNLSELVTAQPWLETDSFGTIAPSASAVDAKNVMAQHPKCADVFVTTDGTPTSTVTRWITNIDLLQAAQV
jgi:hypothetical protein